MPPLPRCILFGQGWHNFFLILLLQPVAADCRWAAGQPDRYMGSGWARVLRSALDPLLIFQ